MRQRLAVKSSAIGLVARMSALVLSLISTRLFVQYIGIEIKGISGIISNMLSLLQLAEMGIGAAIVYALYKPLAENDIESVKSLMAFYKKSYRAIGILILFIGIIVSFFLRVFIDETSYSWDYIYLVFFIQLLTSVSTYLIGAYRRNLLYADQKQYVNVIIDTIANVVFTVVRLCVIVYARSYIAYIILQLIQTITSNLIIFGISQRDYPYLKEKDIKPYSKMSELIGNLKNVVIGKIGGVVYNSTDNIIISKFVGVIAVGYITNYATIKSMVKVLVNSVMEPVRPMIGNYVIENSEVKKSYRLFLNYTFVRFVIGNIITVGLVVLFNPLIDIWLKEGYTLEIIVPILIAMDLYIDILHGPTWEFMNALGLFRSDRNLSYGGAFVNLVSSIILVQIMGTPGVLVGTVIAQCYYWIARAHIIFSRYFQTGRLKYCLHIAGYSVITIIDSIIVTIIRNRLMPRTNIVMFIVMCGICVSVSLLSIMIFWSRTDEYLFMKNMLLQMVNRKNKECVE